MYSHIFTYVQVYSNIFTYSYICLHLFICSYIFFIYVYAHLVTSMHIYLDLFTSMYMSLHVLTCTYIRTHIPVWPFDQLSYLGMGVGLGLCDVARQIVSIPIKVPTACEVVKAYADSGRSLLSFARTSMYPEADGQESCMLISTLYVDGLNTRSKSFFQAVTFAHQKKPVGLRLHRTSTARETRFVSAPRANAGHNHGKICPVRRQ